MRSAAGLATGLLLLGTFGTASAETIVYSDRTAWKNATTGEKTIGFEGRAPDRYFTLLQPGEEIEGVSFSSRSDIYFIDKLYSHAGIVYTMGSGDVLFCSPLPSSSASLNATIVISGLGDATSFSFDLRGYFFPAMAELDILMSDIPLKPELFRKTVIFPNIMTSSFFGLTTDKIISHIGVSARGGVGIDNFSYGMREIRP